MPYWGLEWHVVDVAVWKLVGSALLRVGLPWKRRGGGVHARVVAIHP